jgi:hypothetical protein
MKPLAIHHISYGFTQRWIEYCEINKIPFKKVNCYDTDIINQLKDCSALLWHWNYDDYKDRLIAPSLILSVEKMGLLTLPNSDSCWHFDNKLAQKYLLESNNIPLIKTWAFYDKISALSWLKSAEYPLVFKLKTGAGSQNVKLINNYYKARKYVKKSFGRGFRVKNNSNIIKDRFVLLFRKKTYEAFKNLIKSVFRLLKPKYDVKILPRDRGYIYFQEFLPDNKFDTRLIIIGDRCFGVRRYNRKNDFRASGSGLLEYDPSLFDLKAIKEAFDICEKLNSKTLAIDFLYNRLKNPHVAEISYAFPTGSFTDNCLGYWDKNLNWHPGKFIVQQLMIDDIVSQIKSSN